MPTISRAATDYLSAFHAGWEDLGQNPQRHPASPRLRDEIDSGFVDGDFELQPEIGTVDDSYETESDDLGSESRFYRPLRHIMHAQTSNETLHRSAYVNNLADGNMAPTYETAAFSEMTTETSAANHVGAAVPPRTGPRSASDPRRYAAKARPMPDGSSWAPPAFSDADTISEDVQRYDRRCEWAPSPFSDRRPVFPSVETMRQLQTALVVLPLAVVAPLLLATLCMYGWLALALNVILMSVVFLIASLYGIYCQVVERVDETYLKQCNDDCNAEYI